MKKSAIKIALLAMVAGSLSMFGASADPFGSTESGGAVTCGSGTTSATVPNVGKVIVLNSGGAVGVQGCAPTGNGSALPIRGRVGVYKDANNKVTVFADGWDNNPGGGAAAWDRVTVAPNGQVCVDRNDTGSWDSGNGSLHVCTS